MPGLGSAPMGADYDPRAPWNTPDTETMYRECDYCKGEGAFFYAVNRKTGEIVEVTEATYMTLPTTEALAIARGNCYYRSEEEVCEICNGTGEIEYEYDPMEDYVDPVWRD